MYARDGGWHDRAYQGVGGFTEMKGIKRLLLIVGALILFVFACLVIVILLWATYAFFDNPAPR